MQIICDCPECGLPADVTLAGTLDSTDGDVEHIRTQCPTGHWFIMPVEMGEGFCLVNDDIDDEDYEE